MRLSSKKLSGLSTHSGNRHPSCSYGKQPPFFFTGNSLGHLPPDITGTGPSEGPPGARRVVLKVCCNASISSAVTSQTRRSVITKTRTTAFSIGLSRKEAPLLPQPNARFYTSRGSRLYCFLGVSNSPTSRSLARVSLISVLTPWDALIAKR
jgi:hypothetical protein